MIYLSIVYSGVFLSVYIEQLEVNDGTQPVCFLRSHVDHDDDQRVD